MASSRFIVLLALSACVPEVARPYPPPSAADLLAALGTHVRALKTLRVQIKIDHMAGGGERVKAKVAMLLERPDRLRFEAESPLGGALATVASDGKTFALIDTRENRFLTGPALACNVARFTRVALSPQDIVAALMGGAPIYPGSGSVAWDGSSGGREVLTIQIANGGTEILKLDARDRRWDILSAELRDPRGQRVWRVTNQGFEDRGAGVRLPGQMNIEQGNADLEIKFKSFEPNFTVPDGAFQLAPPAGLAVENVTCN